MKPICRKLQDELAAEGPGVVRNDEAAQQHLAECEDCFAFLESLSELESGLQNMPQLDAPDHAVEALLTRPEIADTLAESARVSSLWERFAAAAARWVRPRTFVWASGAAAAVVLVVAVGVYQKEGLGPSDGFLVVKDENLPAKTGDLPEDSGLDAGQRAAGRDESAAPAEERLRSSGSVESQKPDAVVGGAAVGGDRFAENERKKKEREEARRRLMLFGKANKHEYGQQDQETGEYREGAESLTRRERSDLDKIQSKAESDDPSKDPVPAEGYYANRLSQVPSDAPDDDGRSNVHGSRDFKVIVGGVSHVDPQTGRSTSADSIEELEVVTSGAGVEFGRAEAGLEDEAGAKQLEHPVAEPTAVFEETALPKQKPATPPVAGPVPAGEGNVSFPTLIDDSRVTPAYPEQARAKRLEGHVVLKVVVRADGTVGEITVRSSDNPNHGFEEAAIEAVKQWRFNPAMQDGKPVDVYHSVAVTFELGKRKGKKQGPAGPAMTAARRFLAERASLDGLRFKPASGYWANTYVPGDPTLRLLQSRLTGRDRSGLQAYTQTSLRLHDAARPAAQPFDAPQSSALAVYLHADRRGLTEEGRFLVQVGLQGTERHGGRRPAMNLGLILDLRGEISNEVAIGMRSLLEAFNRAKQPGDRFSLIVAGRPGAVAVEPRDFRHGYLKVTLDRLLAGAEEGRTLGIVDAVATAIQRTAAADDPDTPLGSSAVILITGQALGRTTRTLADLAHQGAVAGVPLSVVGLGPDVDLSEMDWLTLAGQGSRRLLDNPAEADELVDRELSTVGRAIARAVRLRIRLAPGVKLIDVLGSERLDEARAQKVRDAERSIDLRLSRNLGIQADRGEDEEGIQIVIPSFYAGDAHVILLDVAASGSGPIADVTVRYKDLVYLRNGVGRSSLSLGSDERAPGSLERNVLKNLLSLRLSETLDRAGKALASTEPARAAELLEDFETLMTGLRFAVPGLDNDPDVMGDIAMLVEYRTLLAGGVAANVEQRAHLSDSLLYAALLKVLPRPLETGS